jgi:putative addiction module component (TIGR02574 family)
MVLGCHTEHPANPLEPSATILTMTMLEDLKSLPITERADLAQALWDSVLEQQDQLPLPESHRVELERRLNNPEPKYVTWEEAKARLFKK